MIRSVVVLLTLALVTLVNGSGEDARRLSAGVAYSWRQWRMAAAGNFKPVESLSIWNDNDADAVLELFKYTDGSFRYILDSQISSLNPDGSHDEVDRDKIISLLQDAWSGVNNTALVPVLSEPAGTEYVYGKWRLTSKKEKELLIQHLDQNFTIILRENLPGFEHVSTENKQQRFTATTKLNEFPGWMSKKKLILLQPAASPAQ